MKQLFRELKRRNVSGADRLRFSRLSVDQSSGRLAGASEGRPIVGEAPHE